MYKTYETYIIKSNGIYKIGRSKTISQRLKNMRNENPCEIELIKTYPNDIEKYLHKVFDEYRIRNEWFNLPDDWENKFDEVDARIQTEEYVIHKRLSELRVSDPNYIELRQKCLTSWKWKFINSGFDILMESIYWKEIVETFPYGIKIFFKNEVDEVPHEIQLTIRVVGVGDHSELIIDNPMEEDTEMRDLY